MQRVDLETTVETLNVELSAKAPTLPVFWWQKDKSDKAVRSLGLLYLRVTALVGGRSTGSYSEDRVSFGAL